MGMSASAQQQGRLTARVRRIAVEHERVARDQRVAAAAEVAILALGEREARWGQVRAAEVRAGRALQAIIAEGVTAGGAAILCDLSVAEARALRGSARAAQEFRAGAEPAGPDPGGPPDAALPGPAQWQAGRPGAGLTQAAFQDSGATAGHRGYVDVL